VKPKAGFLDVLAIKLSRTDKGDAEDVPPAI
jgi:hypothetical protein